MKSIDSSDSSIHVDSLYIKVRPLEKVIDEAVFVIHPSSCFFGVLLCSELVSWDNDIEQMMAIATIQYFDHRDAVNDLANYFNIWS